VKRRSFIRNTLLGSIIPPNYIKLFSGINGEDYPELKKHRIIRVERVKHSYHWPRHVGKNARKGNHGQYNSDDIFKLFTDQGAMGWALGRNKKDFSDQELNFLQGKLVSELISPEKGIRKDLSRYIDLALHDLMGIILNKPVYKLIGNNGIKDTPIYSGMIYFDELEHQGKVGNIDKILQNCKWDVKYGYQQLKVKIGRSGKWYSHDQGLKMDIEVIQQINKAFPNVKLLVDANDMYSIEDTIEFLKGIGDIPLLWVEEPFRENYNDGKKLREWMDENGFKTTLYADGEANPNHELCMKMGKEGIMNVYLPDIRSFGFTRWRHLMSELKSNNILASPHAWGSMLKTHYNSHLSAAFGNIVTIEGVTCLSDDIDFGNYKIINGKINVSDAPGFGMKLLK
jgi:L-alanine-DL-glutamate epimerase-like enolase superfamily enzyme